MITVQKFLALDKPASDALSWSAGQNHGIVDSVTGDRCLFVYSTANTNVLLYVCAANSNVWLKKATVNVGVQNGLLGVCQDITNGAVHALLFDSTGITNARRYARWALTRSGGHVTGFSVTTSFDLTTHTNSDFDPRGSIYVFKFGGAERLAYIYGYATTSGPTTDFVYYCAESSTLTPSSSASFTGIDGSGSDTLAINLTDLTGIRTNHTFQAWLAQETSTENLFLIAGHVYSGDTLAVTTTGTLNDCWYKQLTKGASGWTAPTATVAGTAFATDNGTTVPCVMGVFTGTSRAYVMYTSPANGVKISYLDSAGALNTISASPLSTANRGGFGALTVDASNNIQAIFNTEGVSGSLNPVNRFAYYDNTQGAWTININGTAIADIITMVGFGQSSACFAAQIVGNSVAQSVTGVVNVAGIFDANPFPVAALKSPPPGRKPGYQPPPNKIQVTGVSAAQVNAYTLTALAGSYAYTGQSATLTRSKVIVASNGTYTYTGQSANLVTGRVLTALNGTYSYAGQSATLLRSKLLTAQNGTYSITGQSATITYTPAATGYTLTAQAGSYAVTGQSTSLLKSYVLACQPGSYNYAGQNAVISYSGSPPISGSNPAQPAGGGWSSKFEFKKRQVEIEEPAIAIAVKSDTLSVSERAELSKELADVLIKSDDDDEEAILLLL